MFETTRRRAMQALGIGGAATVAGCNAEAPTASETATAQRQVEQTSTPTVEQVAADPTDIPDPIDRSRPTTHEVTLTAEEVTAEIEPGVTFDFMTFGGQVPGPMLRVRQGDTVDLTLESPEGNALPHNVDLHAVYGTGGGSIATTATPGSKNAMTFKTTYPGAFIYHCAVPNLDMHISSGMFGMILVEPKGGLSTVDRELYFGQHEVYTDGEVGQEGKHSFDIESMKNENPTYVLLNGEKYAWAAANRGPLEVQQGDRVRVFMVDGGPNCSSNFHPIGNVWKRAYRDGGVPENGNFDAYADRNIQTVKVPPGSCMIGEMDTPVPERIKLVDHALSRVARRGMLAEVDVIGEEREELFDPDAHGTSHEGPRYA